jgi:hypothetical protein
MATKFFKLQEAQELLPFIAPHLEQAREEKQKMESVDQEITAGAARITALGGSIPPYAELARKKAEREQATACLKELIGKILSTGCLIKDLDMGLVDFPSVLKGQEVYLCWKLGEERIEYYHGLQEGFAGRKLLESAEPEEPSGPSLIH